MKYKLILATLAITLSSLAQAEVRPGSSIRASIESSNKVEIENDLAELGIDTAKADTILTAVDKKIVTADLVSQLLSIPEGKRALSKKFVEDLLPAGVNVDANNSSAADLMSSPGRPSDGETTADIRKAEVLRAASLIVRSTSESIPTENLPKIMDYLIKVMNGELSESDANVLMLSESLVNPEAVTDGEVLKAFRECT